MSCEAPALRNRLDRSPTAPEPLAERLITAETAVAEGPTPFGDDPLTIRTVATASAYLDL